ncbi:MAG: carbohydrate ABC transporter permease, partial [Spirochaetaceae bacterium]|nr:carbohydrate ABC transporter permease [Spirochaetaceae bacterium]
MKTSVGVKHTQGENIFAFFNYIFIGIIALMCFYPMLYVLFASFSDNNLLMQHTGVLYRPLGFSVNAYSKVFQNPMILLGYRNTLF